MYEDGGGYKQELSKPPFLHDRIQAARKNMKRARARMTK
jgi:hypothetical protein